MNVHRTDGPREALLIRRRRPIGEPSELIAGPAPGTGLLQGMAGAGRAVQSLAEAGRGVAQVTQL